MNPTLFKAILSMDSYNRGYGQGINLPTVLNSTKIGNSIIIGQSDLDSSHISVLTNFYAAAYKDVTTGQVTISYRGTDNPLNLTGGDLINGWVGGAGFQTSQAVLAFDFYNSVAKFMNNNVAIDPRFADITLTGHSLGGGLAGLVGSTYLKSVAMFDNMPFELATDNLYWKSTDLLQAAAHGVLYDSAMKQIVYGNYNGGTAWQHHTFSSTNPWLTTYHMEGEALIALRLGQSTKDVPFSLGTGVDLPGSIPGINEAVARHSISTLILTMWATEKDAGGNYIRSQDWDKAAKYFWPVMYDNDFAQAMHSDISMGQSIKGTSGYADILRQVIAYSAIDEGADSARPFGDTGIRAFYNDANDFGKVMVGWGELFHHVNGNMGNNAKWISEAFVQYAGQLALAKVLDKDNSLAKDGIITLSEDNSALDVSFKESLWEAANKGVLPNMVAQQHLFDGVLSSISTHYNFKPTIVSFMQELWGTSSYSAFERFIFGTKVEGGTITIPNIDNNYNYLSSKANFFIGSNGNDIINGSYDNDLIYAGGGTDVIYAGAGKDIFISGAGDKIFFGGGGSISYEGLFYPLTSVSITTGYISNGGAYGYIVNKGSLGTDSLIGMGHINLTSLDDTLNIDRNFGDWNNSVITDGRDGEDTVSFINGAAMSHDIALYLRGTSNADFNLGAINLLGDNNITEIYKNFQRFSADYMSIITDGKMGFSNSINNSFYISTIGTLDYSAATQSATIYLSGIDSSSHASIGEVVQTYNTVVRSGVGTNYGDIVHLKSTDFISGLGNDTIYLDVNLNSTSHIVYTGGSDVINRAETGYISLGSNILASDIASVTKSSTQIVITFTNNDTLTLLSGNNSTLNYLTHIPGVNASITFNGQNCTIQALGTQPYIVYSGHGDDFLKGRDTTNDFLEGKSGNDTLEGKKGNDGLCGNEGSDTYIFNIGDGQDVIAESGGLLSQGDINIISFGVGIAKENIRLVRTTSDYEGLYVYYGTSDRILIHGHFYSHEYSIEKIKFNDATFLDLMHGLSLKGTAGNDSMLGTDYNDVLSGLGGDDTLIGGYGEDQYIYNLGDGNNTFIDVGAVNENDAVIFGVGITSSSISISTDGYGVAIAIAGGGSIYLADQFSNADGSTFIETLKFNDGSTIDLRAYNYAFNGTSGDNTIYGTFLNDTINSGAGNDTVYAKEGNDILNGGAGHDFLDGGDGNDTVTYIDAVSGVSVSLLSTVYQNTGGSGYDTLLSIENLIGSTFNDILTGDAGANTVNGAEGNDNLSGLAGDDILIGGAGADILNGGDGVDTIKYITSASAVNINLSTNTAYGGEAQGDIISGIESVVGSIWNDKLTGNALVNTLDGGDGNDTIAAGDGDDTAIGGAGNDNIKGGYGNDSLYGGAGEDYIKGESGADILYGGDSLLTPLGQSDPTYTLYDYLYGGAGNDTLYGEGGNDMLRGESGKDTLYGGLDSDSGSGGSGDDVIYGNEGNDSLYGGDGDDTIYGGSGDDTIRGEEGQDVLYGEDGNDDVRGGLDDNIIYGGAGNDKIYGGSSATSDTFAGSDQLYGGDGNDELYGGFGDDQLDGGAGNDTLKAGDGSDAYALGSGADYIYDSAGVADVLKLQSGMELDDLLFSNGSRDQTDSNDLVVSWNSGLDSIEIENQNTTSPSAHIEKILLSDGALFSFNNYVSWIKGTSADNSLTGNASANSLFGFSGNDTLSGLDGNDEIHGGKGLDTLYGGNGNDLLHGGADNDVLYGESGDDVLYGGHGNDTLNGGDGDDKYYVISGIDTISETGGVDTLFFSGDTGLDDLDFSNTGIDDVTISSLAAGVIASHQRGGFAGQVNLLSFADGFSVDFSRYNEWLVASAVGQTINGDSNNGSGIDSADIIIGRAGIDTLRGYDMNDVIHAGAGADFVYGGNGDDLLHGGAGDDNVKGDAGIDIIYGGLGDDIIYGGSSASETIGDTDYIYAGSGNDTVYGGAGDDMIEGGDGNDTLRGNIGHDTAHGGNGGDDIRMGDGNDTVYGDNGDDTIYGEAGNDSLYGGFGADYISGGDGDDSVEGGSGDDNLIGNTGIDTIRGGAGNDTLYGGYSDADISGEADILYGDDGDDYLKGQKGNDTLYGGSGVDTLRGDEGDDILWGGADGDIFQFTSLSAFNGVDLVKDFVSGLDGDILDVKDVLVGYDRLTSVIADFLSLTEVSGNTQVFVDRDGGGTTYSAQHLATLEGSTGLTLASLVDDGNIRYV